MLAVLGISLVAAYAVGVLGVGDSAHGNPRWTSYDDDGHGLAVEFPATWQRADFPMFARIVNPRSILVLSTFPIPHGAGKGECGYVPSQVRDGIGRVGAAVLIYEHYLEPHVFERKLARRTPARPASLQLDPQHELRTPDAPSREWLFNFRDAGRLLSAAVVLGPEVSTGLRADIVRVLNGLRFRPLAPGAKVGR